MQLDKLKLISPDDRSLLTRKGNSLVDASGRHYSIHDGVPDLRPQTPVQGNVAYSILDHTIFRSYPFQLSLDPIFTVPEDKKGCSFKERVISSFIPPSKNDALCLDHGCGDGILKGFLESRGYVYIGVDNESGVTTGQGGGPQFGGGATHLCDLHRLPFANKQFQFAVSYSVFEHLQNPFVAAQELFRVMEPESISFVAIVAIIPFHMDSFYHHTHFGVLNTFLTAGFDVLQVAPANWNAYVAISQMDGLPGPRWIRKIIGRTSYGIHRLLWYIRTRVKGRDLEREVLRRQLMMAGIIKAVLKKPNHSNL